MMKHGIACIGSTIVDEVLPVIEPGRLTYVDANKFVSPEELTGEHVQFSVGGMATNVSVNLAKLQGNYPLAIFGRIGTDYRAELIVETLKAHHIDMSGVRRDPDNETSSTEVIHFRLPNGAVERIFRHKLGAMGAFELTDVSLNALASYKIAMFGYGLLLPQLDLADNTYGTILGRLLAPTQAEGVWTALDFVSPDPQNSFKFQRYRQTLHYVDILCINEDQAGSLTELSKPEDACRALVEIYGARIAVVHCGAAGPNYAFSESTGLLVQPNIPVSDGECRGNAGAGDAFSAGFLHGMHQEWPIAKALQFAAAAAAVSLGDESCTGAMKSEAEVWEFMKVREDHV